MKVVFDSTCNIPDCENDGMRYDASSITINLIREENEYGGTRVKLNAYLGAARIPLQFDIGIGDSITPAPEISSFPVLLDGEIPALKIYPQATVIAEKVETMVSKGMNNSRMKDFYDVWLLSELFDHDYNTLRRALENTFKRRGTEMPEECPLCLSEEFLNPQKTVQWNAFVRKNMLDNSPDSFTTAILKIREFIMPVITPASVCYVRWQASKSWQ